MALLVPSMNEFQIIEFLLYFYLWFKLNRLIVLVTSLKKQPSLLLSKPYVFRKKLIAVCKVKTIQISGNSKLKKICWEDRVPFSFLVDGSQPKPINSGRLQPTDIVLLASGMIDLDPRFGASTLIVLQQILRDTCSIVGCRSPPN